MATPIIPIITALAHFAPSIMRFFGAGQKPVAVAEHVSVLAKSVTGAQSVDEAITMMHTNAELAQEFNLAVLKADTELETLALSDIADARARDVEIRKLNGGQNKRGDIMVVGVVIGLITCLLVLIVFEDTLPGEAVGIISTIAGIFGGCLKDAFSFEFGRTRGDEVRDNAITEIAKMP